MPATRRRDRSASSLSLHPQASQSDEAASRSSNEASSGGVSASNRILTAAHNLFASRGLGVSLREITEAAHVNIAAVNYHFGSKEQLTELVFDRLSREVNTRRLEELDGILRSAANCDQPPQLDDIIVAFVRPYLEATDEGQLLARLILQHRVEPTKLTQHIIRTHFDPMADKFIEALRLAVPDRSESTFAWRYMFMVSTVVLTMTDNDQGGRLLRLSQGKADPRNISELQTALLSFLRGGLAAP